jgi:CPA2 family monovalent cation:H+ antiporter-2
MLLNLQAVMQNMVPILGLFVALVVGKFIIVFVVASAMRLPLRVAILTAAALAQVGEFSFVLLQAANGTGLLEQPLMGNLTVAIILSMLATPFALAVGPHLASGLGKLNPLTRVLAVRTTDEVEADALRDHVIIAGYGLTGRTVARALAERNIRYIIVDVNTENVHDAVRVGELACFGDATSAEVLEHLGAAHARWIVIAINDPDATGRATRAARLVAPDLRITVRAVYEGDVERLTEAGATHVVTAEAAAAAAISAHVANDVDSGGPPDARVDPKLAAGSPARGGT